MSGRGTQSSLACIAKVAELHENAGNLRIPGKPESTPAKTQISRPGGNDAFQASLNTRGKTVTIHPPIVGLRASDLATRTTVIMEANKNGTTLATRQGHSVVEIDKAVPRSDEDRSELTSQFIGKALGRIEREVLLIVAGMTRDRSRVSPPMAGIDDHRLKPLRPWSMAPVIEGKTDATRTFSG